jgi:CheY-like chemotaxis protein
MMNTPRSVLVVENDRISSIEITRLLEKAGYNLTASVPTGEEAITVLRAEHPDIVLMDIQLDGTLDGIQCAEIINQKYSVPLVYLTAYNDDDTLERAKQTGPYGFISKPVAETELRTTLEMALAKYRLETEQRNSRNLLSATLSAIREGVITAGEDFTVQFMNPAAEKMAGEDAERSGNREMDSLFKLQDKTGKEHAFRELISSRNPPFTFSGKITGRYSRNGSFLMELSVNRERCRRICFCNQRYF